MKLISNSRTPLLMLLPVLTLNDLEVSVTEKRLKPTVDLHWVCAELVVKSSSELRLRQGSTSHLDDRALYNVLFNIL